MFNSLEPHVVFQEVPNEVSLAFLIMGCPLKCEGCHSQDTWQRDQGFLLTNNLFKNYLEKYQAMITCVVFMGGEWNSQALIEKLIIAKKHQLKTCLYTGLTKAPNRITQQLDYIKTGPWLSSLGGLDNPNTNQRFVDLNTNICLNQHFRHC